MAEINVIGEEESVTLRNPEKDAEGHQNPESAKIAERGVIQEIEEEGDCIRSSFFKFM